MVWVGIGRGIASEMTATDLGIAWVDTQLSTLNDVREWMVHVIDQERIKNP